MLRRCEYLCELPDYSSGTGLWTQTAATNKNDPLRVAPKHPVYPTGENRRLRDPLFPRGPSLCYDT